MFALFNLNLVVLLLLLVLLFRNMVKLSFERRQGVLGSRFKTKLVLAFLSLALTPGILIFIIASNFINTSIEGWFKPQVERPLDHALEVAQTYYQTLEGTALRHARFLARAVEREGLLAPVNREVLAGYLRGQQERLGVAAITVYSRQGEEVVHVADPALAGTSTRLGPKDQLRAGLAGQEVTTVQEIENGDMIQAVAPIRAADRQVVGALVVASHVGQRLEARLRSISEAFQEYKQLKLLRNPIKGVYILLFLLLTLIIVFSATWFGLYLARGITDPIQLLAQGTREVAAGNLSYRVQVRANDEIGVLVDSFNRMTHDLALSQSRLEQAYLDLSAKHDEMEQRRRYTETVLEAVATGVVSLDHAGRITTVNRAAERMLGIGATAAQGRPAPVVFRGPEFSEVAALIQRASRLGMGTLEREVHVRRDGHAVTLLASATTLREPDGGRNRDGAGVRRPDRAAQGAAPRRLARGGAAAGPRDQEPAHAHPAVGPAPPAPTRRQPDAGREAASRGGDGDHHPGGRRPEAARRRVLALREDARPDAGAHGSRPPGGGRWSPSIARPIRR